MESVLISYVQEDDIRRNVTGFDNVDILENKGRTVTLIIKTQFEFAT
jgi:hypothetical protein